MGITQQLKKGEPFNTETKQTGIYVAAKRLGLTVKTERIDDNTIRVTFVDEPKEPTLINRIADLSPPERLALFEHFELCCGMNRGSCVCEAEQISQPIQPIADERKSVLNALQAKIDAIQDHNIADVLESQNEWTGWTPEQQTYDDVTGEMRTYRKHIKTGRTKWIDSETYFG